MTDESAPLILIIDDDEVICNVAARILRAAHYRVSIASNADDGIEYFRRDRPDLVLIDFAMPRRNGFDAVSEMRRIEGPESHAVMIMLTAFSENYLASTDSGVVVDGHITKPIRQDGLVAYVRDMLSSHRAGQ